MLVPVLKGGIRARGGEVEDVGAVFLRVVEERAVYGVLWLLFRFGAVLEALRENAV